MIGIKTVLDNVQAENYSKRAIFILQLAANWVKCRFLWMWLITAQHAKYKKVGNESLDLIMVF